MDMKPQTHFSLLVIYNSFLLMTKIWALPGPDAPSTVRITSGVYSTKIPKSFAELTETVHFFKPLSDIPIDAILKQADSIAANVPSTHIQFEEVVRDWRATVISILEIIRYERKTEVFSFQMPRELQLLGNVFRMDTDVWFNSLEPDIKNLHKSVKQLSSNQSVLKPNVVRMFGVFKNYSVPTPAIVPLGPSNQYRHEEDQIENRALISMYMFMLQSTSTLLEIVTEQLFLQDVMSLCARNILSPQLLSKQELIDTLHELLQRPSLKGWEVAVDDVEVLYSEKLTQCVLAGQYIHVRLIIPLKTSNRKWQLVSYLPIPFAWQNSICTLFPDHEQILMAVDGAESVPLTGIEERQCRENSICQIPRTDVSFAPVGKCIAAIVSQRTVADLLPYCEFQCQPKMVPEIIRLAPDQVVVASPVNVSLEVRCGSNQIKYQSGSYGSYRITVPENCSLLINDKIAVHRRKLLPVDLASQGSVEFLLPALWSNHLGLNLETLADLDSSPKYANHPNLLNKSWSVHGQTFFPSPLSPPLNIAEHISQSKTSYDRTERVPEGNFILSFAVGILFLLLVGNLVLTGSLHSKLQALTGGVVKLSSPGAQTVRDERDEISLDALHGVQSRTVPSPP